MAIHELRWFVARPIGDDELRLFGRPIDRRRDDYLLGTGDARGLKRRGSRRLEDKRRGGVLELEIELEIELGGRTLRGNIERWTKRIPTQPAPDGEWVGVTKRRVLARFGRCRAELTGLELPRAGVGAHQTLALELPQHLAAQPDALRPMFETGLRELARAHPELIERFAEAPSLGYPEWLARTLASN